MSLFEIHTEENGKDVDFGVHGVYADNEKDAIKYAETEIVADFLSMRYSVETKRKSKTKKMPECSIIHAWNIHKWNNEDVKDYRITIWVRQVK